MKKQWRQCSRVGKGIRCGTGGFVKAEFTGKIKLKRGKSHANLRKEVQKR